MICFRKPAQRTRFHLLKLVMRARSAASDAITSLSTFWEQIGCSVPFVYGLGRSACVPHQVERFACRALLAFLAVEERYRGHPRPNLVRVGYLDETALAVRALAASVAR